MVVEISQVEDSLIKHFIDTQDNCLLFQSYDYYCFLKDYLGALDFSLVSIDEGGNVNGCMFILGKEGRFGTVLNSLPFYGSNGGIIASNVNAKQEIADYYNKLIQGNNIVSSTVITSPLIDDVELYRNHINYNFEDYRIGQLTPLNYDSPSDILDSFHSKTRNMVRKAEKSNVVIDIDNDAMDFIVDVHEKNMNEISGKAKSPEFFDSIQKHYSKGEDYQIYVASLDGQYIAGLLILNYKNIVEYFTPVVLSEYRNTQALSLIIYQVMKDKYETHDYLNWGGTWATQEGVHRFKKRWNSVDKNYFYFTQLNDLSLLQEDLGALCNEYEYFYLFPFSASENA
ncbi:GNAT family N-acetyltransferase [Paraneptunicella aestuarii]|uniref:GNAT family N-acetyltransferase n=1 Tax=Paraneptunicella aestuarii TaxID=2831148 RepID=UPI001E32392B|nr:GNAT family N-acetyltransferase [Paraneptunicella aestuarii]UAA39678.1 GNAT family N-acetyltransferase [Paraneptunicella aestuarii]